MDSLENPSEGIPVIAETLIKTQEDKSWAKGFEVDSKVLDLTGGVSGKASNDLRDLNRDVYKEALGKAVEANGVWGNDTRKLQLVKVATVREVDPQGGKAIERILVMTPQVYREQLEKAVDEVAFRSSPPKKFKTTTGVKTSRSAARVADEEEPSWGEYKEGREDEFSADKDAQEEYRLFQARGGGKNKMEHSFEVVGYHAYNLDNVRGLRERYPEEYATRMGKSIHKPERSIDGDGWYSSTWAYSVLRGISDADEVEYIERNSGGNRFGIPPEFLEIPYVHEHMITLINRPNVPEDVREYLRREYLGNSAEN